MKRNRLLFTALAAGATYLMKNKDARDKLMNGIRSMTNRDKANNQTTEPVRYSHNADTRV